MIPDYQDWTDDGLDERPEAATPARLARLAGEAAWRILACAALIVLLVLSLA